MLDYASLTASHLVFLHCGAVTTQLEPSTACLDAHTYTQRGSFVLTGNHSLLLNWIQSYASTKRIQPFKYCLCNNSLQWCISNDKHRKMSRTEYFYCFSSEHNKQKKNIQLLKAPLKFERAFAYIHTSTTHICMHMHVTVCGTLQV